MDTVAKPAWRFCPAKQILSYYHYSFLQKFIVFTVNEHQKIRIAGLNCRVGIATEWPFHWRNSELCITSRVLKIFVKEVKLKWRNFTRLETLFKFHLNKWNVLFGFIIATGGNTWWLCYHIFFLYKHFIDRLFFQRFLPVHLEKLRKSSLNIIGSEADILSRTGCVKKQ